MKKKMNLAAAAAAALHFVLCNTVHVAIAYGRHDSLLTV